MDDSLLTALYAIHSPTGNEWGMICFVRQWVKEHVPEATVEMDRLGNLYITKGGAGEGYPTLACHLDQVQTLHSDDFEVREEDGTLFGWSERNQRREGLGADDKNGIWVGLQCLEACPRLKVFMAVGEEKGCIGSNRADMAFFADSLYVIEPDRRGGEEPSVVLRGIPCASEDFVDFATYTGEAANAYDMVITKSQMSNPEASLAARTFSDLPKYGVTADGRFFRFQYSTSELAYEVRQNETVVYSFMSLFVINVVATAVAVKVTR